jgi:tyrosinase
MLNYPRTSHILVFTKIPDLTPFWKSKDNEYWQSKDIEHTIALKYSYPEFDHLDLNNPNAVKIAIGEKVKKLYDSQAGPGGKKLFSRLHAEPSAEGVRAQEASDVINEWSIRIHVKKYELSGSFSVLIFLGEVPEDPEEWCTSPSYVGGHYAFVNSAAGQCDNCRSQEDLVVEGFVYLNLAIAERSGLPSYEPSVVHPYLKDNLSWRIQSVRAFSFVVSCR